MQKLQLKIYKVPFGLQTKPIQIEKQILRLLTRELSGILMVFLARWRKETLMDGTTPKRIAKTKL